MVTYYAVCQCVPSWDTAERHCCGDILALTCTTEATVCGKTSYTDPIPSDKNRDSGKQKTALKHDQKQTNSTNPTPNEIRQTWQRFNVITIIMINNQSDTKTNMQRFNIIIN